MTHVSLDFALGHFQSTQSQPDTFDTIACQQGIRTISQEGVARPDHYLGFFVGRKLRTRQQQKSGNQQYPVAYVPYLHFTTLAADVTLQLLDFFLLVRNDRLYEVAYRYHSGYLTVDQYGQMANTSFGHQGHAIIH